jgi:hypothetical protein
MGHSFIYYEKDHELFNDIDLWALRHFFIQEAKAMEAERPSERNTKLREFFEGWDWQGPGVYIGTDFSTYICGQKTRWELMFQLLKRSNQRIAEFGEFIPLDYLTAHLSTSQIHFNNAWQNHSLAIYIGKITAFLKRHEPAPE